MAPRPEPRPARRPDPVGAAAPAKGAGAFTGPTTGPTDLPAGDTSAPVWTGAYPPPGAAAASARPATVLTAVIATVVTSVVIVGVAVAALFVVAGDRASFESDVAREMSTQRAYQDVYVDPGLVVDAFLGMLVVFAVWALVAIVLALMTLRRSNGARIALVVSAICAALASLIRALVVVPLLVTAVCVTVAVLLLRRDAAAWFTTRGPADGPPPALTCPATPHLVGRHLAGQEEESPVDRALLTPQVGARPAGRRPRGAPRCACRRPTHVVPAGAGGSS